MIVKVYKDPGYFMRILIQLDELGAGICGLPDDLTISSWCGLWKSRKGWRRIVAYLGYLALDRIQALHCERAIINDESRAQFILKYIKES